MISNIKDYYTLYNSIMNLDEKTRFVTILDKSGTVVFGGQREGIKNHLSETEQKKSIQHALDSWFLRSEFSEKIGDGKYAMAKYGKIKRFTIPLNYAHLLYITTEPEINDSFIEDVLKLKEAHEKNK
ncbi:MAG: hypothetical protein OEM53_00225 [Nitrosopumilus sp.]|nr:hypothetical protein [Nitrosopumilus sp.]